MCPWEYGWSGEQWFLGPTLLGLLVVGVLVLVVVLLLRGGRGRSRRLDFTQIDGALGIVDRRYAQGAITKEQHADMKRVLKG